MLFLSHFGLIMRWDKEGRKKLAEIFFARRTAFFQEENVRKEREKKVLPETDHLGGKSSHVFSGGRHLLKVSSPPSSCGASFLNSSSLASNFFLPFNFLQLSRQRKVEIAIITVFAHTSFKSPYLSAAASVVRFSVRVLRGSNLRRRKASESLKGFLDDEGMDSSGKKQVVRLLKNRLTFWRGLTTGGVHKLTGHCHSMVIDKVNTVFLATLHSPIIIFLSTNQRPSTLIEIWPRQTFFLLSRSLTADIFQLLPPKMNLPPSRGRVRRAWDEAWILFPSRQKMEEILHIFSGGDVRKCLKSLSVIVEPNPFLAWDANHLYDDHNFALMIVIRAPFPVRQGP